MCVYICVSVCVCVCVLVCERERDRERNVGKGCSLTYKTCSFPFSVYPPQAPCLPDHDTQVLNRHILEIMKEFVHKIPSVCNSKRITPSWLLTFS